MRHLSISLLSSETGRREKKRIPNVQKDLLHHMFLHVGGSNDFVADTWAVCTNADERNFRAR